MIYFNNLYKANTLELSSFTKLKGLKIKFEFQFFVLTLAKLIQTCKSNVLMIL